MEQVAKYARKLKWVDGRVIGISGHVSGNAGILESLIEERDAFVEWTEEYIAGMKNWDEQIQPYLATGHYPYEPWYHLPWGDP